MSSDWKQYLADNKEMHTEVARLYHKALTLSNIVDDDIRICEKFLNKFISKRTSLFRALSTWRFKVAFRLLKDVIWLRKYLKNVMKHLKYDTQQADIADDEFQKASYEFLQAYDPKTKEILISLYQFKRWNLPEYLTEE